MRKSKPVIILLSIQLLIAVTFALINPINDFIIRTKGTEYTFATQEAALYGDFTDFVEIQCHIKYGFDYDRFEYYPEQYAIIETDENGISNISALSDVKPENKDWLGTEKKPFGFYNWYTQKLDYELYEKGVKNTSFFDRSSLTFSDEYDITVNVSVYKGKAVFNEILVDGVEIEKFIENTEGEQI